MNDHSHSLHLPPEPKWIVTIPRGGNFQVHMQKLNIWQRLWMRFIGWQVSPAPKGSSE